MNELINEVGQGVFSNAFSIESAKEGDLLFCFKGDSILVHGSEDSPTLPLYGELTPLCHHIFYMDGRGCYISEEMIAAPEGYYYTNAPALARNHSDRKTAFAVITAHQLSKWENSRAFCGRCGAKTKRSNIERAMVCPKCGLIEYPKICPAIITAVSHNGKLLMARSRHGTRFSLIAGFVEIGETFEETVKREVMEEVGLKVKNVRYFKNQPWGFSDTQMIGFTAELDGDEIPFTLQESEIAEAAWFSPEDVPLPASDISIASELIWDFLTRHGIERKNNT